MPIAQQGGAERDRQEPRDRSRAARDLLPALHPGWAKTEPGARVDVDASVAGMRGVIHRAGRHHTGSFLTYADQPLPW